ncbi:MAG: AMP-binding protein [Candidatus Dormibacteraeota bacterium]|nr:AMP-binding protein [Candidatus Dormibacteraeota bacterium]MBV9525076.1 AMP-binding protein [Candidatus Dormibacteraeota bacterium]
MSLPDWFDPGRWVPPPGYADTCNVVRLMGSSAATDFPGFLQQAARDPGRLYPAAFEDLALEWMAPWQRIVDESRGAPWADWFVGARANVARLCVERWPASRPALIWEGDDGSTRCLTFSELDDSVRRAAAGLSALGVRRGDVVAMHLPMVPEAVISLLAAARLGAIAQPSFSGYGVDALVERLELGGAEVLITADGALRRGRRVNMRSVVDAAVRRTTRVRHVVTVQRLDERPQMPPVAGLHWDELLSASPDGWAEAFEAQTPFLLAFTSGSTGRPKGVVHTHGGLPYRFALELAYCANLNEGDRLAWVTDMGWIMGPLATIGPLALGATAVLFEGVPDHPDPDRLWRLVEAHDITHLGLSPTVARSLAAAGDAWADDHEVPSLRVLLSTGEPWTIPAWRWVHRHVARGTRPIINITGGAEIGGTILAGSPLVPTDAGRFAGPGPGMAVDVYDDSGRPLVGAPGELVITKSWPSMTRGFWNEPDRYLETYWSRWPGVWVHGDRAVRYADGSWELIGRSDDVIKVAGKRLGPAELESLATEVPEVEAAAAVGLPDPIRGEQAVVVIQASAGDAELVAAVRRRLEDALGRAFKPHVVACTMLPLTRSGKVHRRAVRAWLQGADAGDLSTLENPEAETAIAAAAASLRPAGS